MADRRGDTPRRSVVSFLGAAPPSAAAQQSFDHDLASMGYVMNTSKLWAHDPVALERLSALLDHVVAAGSLTFRHRAILIASCAAALGDSYCALAWGSKLASDAGAEVAAHVLRGDIAPLDGAEQALARWARQLARDPNSTTFDDVEALRLAGFTDSQIFAVSVYVALRIAFSTVNDALGAHPDAQLGAETPSAVRAAVTFGRPIATEPSEGGSPDAG